MLKTETARPAAISEVRLNSFLAQTYLLMSFGLLITGIVSSLTSNNLNFLLRLNTNPWIAFGLFIIQVAVVVGLSAAALRLSPAVAGLLFIFYAALTGLTISAIFLVYTQEQIASVFWISAGTFFLTSLFGMLFKRDLSTYGNVIFMLLLGWTIAWMFSWLFPFSSLNWGLTFIGIALFVGLTAYDAQRLKQIGQQMDTHPARGGLVVIGALTLYLDFINLFLLILRTSRR
jgi:FtsH-binding integral membrane protein